MASNDPWRKKADNLRTKARTKGGIAVFWRDGVPVNDPAAVQSTDRIEQAPDEAGGLIGVYDGGTAATDIRDDMLNSLAEVQESPETVDGHPMAAGDGSGTAEPPTGQEERTGCPPEPEAGAAPDPLPAGPGGATEAEPPTQATATAGEPSGPPRPARGAADPGAGMPSVMAGGQAAAPWSSADVAGLRAVLCERYAAAHRAGHAGQRELVGELMRRLEGMEYRAVR